MNLFVLSVAGFLGPFLLFQIEPIVAKLLLPVFGGTPAVWSACTMFFQLALLVGYLAALVFDRYLTASRQLKAFGAVLLLTIPLLPWNVEGPPLERSSAVPALQVTGMLVVLIAAPFAALAMVSPLLQTIASRVSLIRSPYRLYALSNAGSLLSLLIYPFVVEPRMSLSTQLNVWSWMYVVFICSIGALAVRVAGRDEVPRSPVANSPASEPLIQRLLWIALPCVSTVLLLAATSHICADISPMPLLWIVPLSLFLLSFILPFSFERMYSAQFVLPFAALLLCEMGAGRVTGSGASTAMLLGYSLVSLFTFCLACHGELYLLRPPAERLSSYYLSMATGGALGGLFVGLFAPVLFRSLAELPISLCGVITTCTLSLWVRATKNGERILSRSVLYSGSMVVTFLLANILINNVTARSDEIASDRNFFGVVTVRDVNRDAEAPRREMILGKIIHGAQYLSPEKSLTPTTYYARTTALGELLSRTSSDAPRRIGAVGLGVGTIAAYSRAGDVFRFYEINPRVIEYAKTYFTFLSSAAGAVEILPGDARLTLDHEPSQQYDLLLLDAFTGDAIPTHLLTIEAFRIYARHLKPSGTIAMHVSNRHLDLRPVLRAVAREQGWTYCARPEDDGSRVTYVFLSAQPVPLTDVECFGPAELPLTDPLWTDQRVGIARLFRW